MQGSTTTETFTLPACIGGKMRLALVDTGCTRTYMDLKFSTRTAYAVLNTPLQNVLVAGGGTLHSGAAIPNSVIDIQDTVFKHTFKTLPLPEYYRL